MGAAHCVAHVPWEGLRTQPQWLPHVICRRAAVLYCRALGACARAGRRAHRRASARGTGSWVAMAARDEGRKEGEGAGGGHSHGVEVGAHFTAVPDGGGRHRCAHCPKLVAGNMSKQKQHMAY